MTEPSPEKIAQMLRKYAPFQKCRPQTPLEHKRIHPFDVFAMLQDVEVTDVIRRGREKVTVDCEGYKPYTYWATVLEINGELYTETTTVEPNTATGIAMMLEFKANSPKMPKATVRFSELEINNFSRCAFQMSSTVPGTGAIYCNREKGHSGQHSHTFPFTRHPGQIIDVNLPPPRWVIIAMMLVAGMVFGAAVTALVLLTPTQ